MSWKVSIVVCFFFVIGCNDIQVGRVGDILDLLEDDSSGRRGQSSNSSPNSETNSNTNQPNNLNYYGLTDSPTGTNTYGSTGTTVGNPLGY